MPCHTTWSRALSIDCFSGPLSFLLPFQAAASSLLQVMSYHRASSNIGPPFGPSAAGRLNVPWMFPMLVCHSWAAMLLLGSFLSLVPGMAFVNLTGSSKKPPKAVGEETFSAELRCQKSRLQLGCHLH